MAKRQPKYVDEYRVPQKKQKVYFTRIIVKLAEIK